MTVTDVRRNALLAIMQKRFHGKQSELARAIGRPDNLVSRILSAGKNRKSIGEKLARDIEGALHLKPYELDGLSQPSHATTPPPAAKKGKPEIPDLIRERARKLAPEIQKDLLRFIETVLAASDPKAINLEAENHKKALARKVKG